MLHNITHQKNCNFPLKSLTRFSQNSDPIRNFVPLKMKKDLAENFLRKKSRRGAGGIQNRAVGSLLNK